MFARHTHKTSRCKCVGYQTSMFTSNDCITPMFDSNNNQTSKLHCPYHATSMSGCMYFDTPMIDSKNFKTLTFNSSGFQTSMFDGHDFRTPMFNMHCGYPSMFECHSTVTRTRPFKCCNVRIRVQNGSLMPQHAESPVVQHERVSVDSVSRQQSPPHDA